MLAEWLAPVEVTTFLRTHLRNLPYARPGAAKGAVPLLQWETLDRVLRSPPPIDVVTVRGGQLVDVASPRSLVDAQDLMKHGISTVVRASERHDAGLAAVASEFTRCLPGEVHIQLYATPAGANSYGWHYDFEDVFIAQTVGIKDYYFRDNTVARDTVLGEALDFSSFRNEQSPLFSSRLVSGDWLYIPARWWHVARCVEDSLSISIGVMPPDALRSAKRVPSGWTGA